MDYDQGWRGLGQLLVWICQWEGDDPLGKVESHGEHLLLPGVELPGLLDLKEKTLKIAMHITAVWFGSWTNNVFFNISMLASHV